MSSGLIKNLEDFSFLARYLYICILNIYGGCSSVGRISHCGCEGHGFKSHHSPKNNKWRVGRVDDCGGLENRWSVTGPGGSNPSPSAGSGKILGAQGQVVQHTCSR